MLHCQRYTANDMLSEFNANKSFCIVFCDSVNQLSCLHLGKDVIEYGAHLLST